MIPICLIGKTVTFALLIFSIINTGKEKKVCICQIERATLGPIFSITVDITSPTNQKVITPNIPLSRDCKSLHVPLWIFSLNMKRKKHLELVFEIHRIITASSKTCTKSLFVYLSLFIWRQLCNVVQSSFTLQRKYS